VFAINSSGEPKGATLRYALRDANFQVAEEDFESGGKKFRRGTFVVQGVERGALEKALTDAGLQATALTVAPSVKMHPARAARIAYVHTWVSTQMEGWWRLALDDLKIPYDYISTQTLAGIDDLNAKYDVILFPPVGFEAGASTIVNGLPTNFGNALPWKNTPDTPNLGKNDSTDDMRPGLGWQGLARLQAFVAKGGVLLTATDTSSFAMEVGMVTGMSSHHSDKMKIVGSVVGLRMVDAGSPIAYGYDEKVSAYCDNGPIFSLSSYVNARGRRRLGEESHARATGRGSADDQDFIVGRAPGAAPEEEKKTELWQAPPVTDEEKVNYGSNYRLIPEANRPRVILRYADTKDLLISGLVDNGGDIAQHPAVVDAPAGKGHVVLFSINPVYRGETRGTYSLVLNTIMNFDSLDVGKAEGAR
jgi:hypothetical protein